VILPINTTQYALELDDYLNKYVLCVSENSLSHTLYRVEDILPSLKDEAKNLDFSSLRRSIQGLQDASAKLDREKAKAEAKLMKLVKWIPGRRRLGTSKRRTSVLHRTAEWVRKMFGVPLPTDADPQLSSLCNMDSWERYLAYAVDVDLTLHQDLEQCHDTHEQFPFPFPISEFIKAAKRVGAANRKLMYFERGFLSKEGIKDREWYLHLGVAPGKWLGKCCISILFVVLCADLVSGYGATTFPALTEAITIEKNVTQIREEAGRLVALIDALAFNITP